MTDLSKLLAESDPVNADAALTPGERAVMRQRVLAHARSEARPFWTSTVAAAAGLASVVAVGIVVARRADPPHNTVASRSAPREPERRQMQFATPGGTQVIWIFNDTFENEVQ